MDKKEEQLKKIIKKLILTNKLRIFKISITFVILVFLLYGIYMFYEFNYTFLKNEFGGFFTPIISMALYIVLMFNSILVFCLYYLQLLYKIRIPWFLIITILLMISAFIIGYFVLKEFLGKPNLDSILRDSSNNVVGEIDCEDESRNFLANSVVSCDFKPRLNNFTAELKFYYSNNEVKFEKIYNRIITFTSSRDMRRVDFYIDGFDENNDTKHLEVGRDFTFYTEEENIERNDKFIAYLLGLLAVIAFSIPSTMANFKKLYGD